MKTFFVSEDDKYVYVDDHTFTNDRHHTRLFLACKKTACKHCALGQKCVKLSMNSNIYKKKII